MTLGDPDSRRAADELRRRERQRPGTEAPVDPATLAALFEKHEGEVARIIGQAEAAWTEKIDAIATAQGAAAERLRREIAEKMKGGGAGEIAALERRLREDQRVALAGLSTGLKQEFNALKQSLDTREGGVFAEIDRVAEKVVPAAEALGRLQQAVVGTTTAAHDVAAIREAVVDSRSAVDEVVTIRKTVTDSRKAIADVVAMRPVLGTIAAGLETWSTNTRRLRWFGWTLLVVLSLLFGAGGVWLQRETGIWPPLAEVENRERDVFWERHGEQVTACQNTARQFKQAMACTIVVMDP